MFEFYLKEIKNHSLLSAEEEKELVEKIKKGDGEARNKLIQSNLRLVIFIAKRYAYRFPHLFSDFVQEGNIGLLKAADDFNLEYKCKFSAFAGKYIENAIEWKIGLLLKLSAYHVSLNEPIIEDEEKTVGDFIKDENAIDPSQVSCQTSLKKLIAEAVSKLETDEQKVINAIFGLENDTPLNYPEINMDAKKAKIIIKTALKKLKTDSNIQHYRAACR